MKAEKIRDEFASKKESITHHKAALRQNSETRGQLKNQLQDARDQQHLFERDNADRRTGRFGLDALNDVQNARYSKTKKLVESLALKLTQAEETHNRLNGELSELQQAFEQYPAATKSEVSAATTAVQKVEDQIADLNERDRQQAKLIEQAQAATPDLQPLIKRRQDALASGADEKTLNAIEQEIAHLEIEQKRQRKITDLAEQTRAGLSRKREALEHDRERSKEVQEAAQTAYLSGLADKQLEEVKSAVAALEAAYRRLRGYSALLAGKRNIVTGARIQISISSPAPAFEGFRKGTLIFDSDVIDGNDEAVKLHAELFG